MSDTAFRGAFPHQHHDPRRLAERIEAQLAERIEDAVDMCSLKTLVDRRQRDGRPAPEAGSDADRREFGATILGLLEFLRDAFEAEATPTQRDTMQRAAATHTDDRRRLLAMQVVLARELPDYWQRLEAHQQAFATTPSPTAPPPAGWLGRLSRPGRPRGAGP